MGILSSIGAWVATNLPTVTKFVKKAAEVVHKTASIVEALLEGRTILVDDEKLQSAERTKNHNSRPDVMGERQSHSTEMAELQLSIDESKKKLITIEETNDMGHRRIQLQIDVMELVVSSSTFERFTNNINLHAANLQIHLQTIQNTAGLLDDVNRQRVAIKALMGTVNHLVNVMNVGDKVKKLEGLDIDMRPGSISILGAYEAFENTRGLLLQEIESFSDAIQEQMVRIESVRSAARRIPDVSRKISSWLSDSVEPKLLDAKKSSDELKGELLVIPRLEANLRRELATLKPDEA
jgi:hypothetical protein